MRLKNFDLIMVMLIVVINIGWAHVPNRSPIIGIILALPLTLILPGYTITQAILHRQSFIAEPSNSLFLHPNLKLARPINNADHIILSLGLSMAVDVVVGFALNILPIGLQGQSWILSLGVIITIFSLLTAVLRRKDAVKVTVSPRHSISISTTKYVLFGLAVLIATTSIWLSVIRSPVPQPSFTQFWMLPAKNTSCKVLIGIHSFEATSVTYRVVVTSNNSPVTTWSRVVLAPQQTWNQSVPINLQTSKSMYVEARLYLIDKPETIYREVHVTLNSIAANGNQKIESCE